MAKITRVPSPGPDDPIFREGIRLTSGLRSTGSMQTLRAAMAGAKKRRQDKKKQEKRD